MRIAVFVVVLVIQALPAPTQSAWSLPPGTSPYTASLNDRHSFLLPPSASNAFRTGGASNPPADVRLLSDRIGYVMVPAYGGAEPTASQAYATRLHENLSRIAPQATCGWIVDLRSNGGGNM